MVVEPRAYPAGVPCWIDTVHADPHRTSALYSALFGWSFAEDEIVRAGDVEAPYLVARKDGLDVGAVRVGVRDGGHVAEWTTYVSVASLDDGLERATAAGASPLSEPVEVPPAGRSIVLRDPVGSTIGLWEPAARAGAQLVNESCAWVLSVLHPSDVDAAKEFYASMFGWTYDVVPRPAGDVVLCRLPGYFGGRPDQPAPRDTVAVMVVEHEPHLDQETSKWLPEFWVDDLDAARSTVPRVGGSVVADPYERPGFLPSVLVADAEGARFSLGLR